MSTFVNARLARFATVLAVLLALLVSGVVAGAAGGNLILGQANDSGTAQTTLNNAGLGAAFTLKTTNVSTNATGIFGWSSQTGTNATNGVFGRVDGPNSYGVHALQGSDTAGSGAAVFAQGGANSGLVATTTSAVADALRGTNSGGGQALDLVVNAGVAPMSVNSDTKVANLNADKLDGLDYDDILQGDVVRISHSVPLTATNSYATWFTAQFTQPAGYVLTSLAAEATVTAPSTCPGGSSRAFVNVDLDVLELNTAMAGQRQWTVETANLSTRIVLADKGQNLVAPGSPTTRTVTVRIFEECTGGAHWTFTNFTLDVVFAK